MSFQQFKLIWPDCCVLILNSFSSFNSFASHLQDSTKVKSLFPSRFYQTIKFLSYKIFKITTIFSCLVAINIWNTCICKIAAYTSFHRVFGCGTCARSGCTETPSCVAVPLSFRFWEEFNIGVLSERDYSLMCIGESCNYVDFDNSSYQKKMNVTYLLIKH